MTTYTLTFGDRSENHTGMQINGNEAESGFTVNKLSDIKTMLDDEYSCELYDLSSLGIISGDKIKLEPASVLVIRDCLRLFGDFSAQEMYQEQEGVDYDTRAFMYGRVVNKKARHNVCFSDQKSRIVNFSDCPYLNEIRDKLAVIFGDKAASLQCEGNKYYNVNKCYIGWHGDTERKIVIGLRLGETFPLYFRWYHKFKPITQTQEIILNSDDIYIMSEKAVGNDWKKSNKYTLRHAATLDMKYITKKSK